MADKTPIAMIAAKNAGNGLGRITVPRMPYIPPPVDPRGMPAWYERFFAEHSRWVDQLNEAVIGQLPKDTLG